MVTRTRLWKITLLLLLGLFVFLYLFVNTVAEFYFAVTNPAAGLHFHYHKDVNRVVIHGVVEEGPADLAGLQRGDQIVAVNGHSINSQWDFIRALLSLELGKLAEIEALRDNLHVKIAFVSERVVNFKLVFLSLLPGMMFGYMLCLIGVFVLLKRVDDKEAHLFYLMLIFWALAMRETFPQGYMLHNILPFWFRDMLLLPAWPLAVGLFLHFHLVFPVENQTFARRRRLFLLLIYAPVLLIVPHLYAYLNGLAWVTSFLRIGWGIWLSLYFTIALAVLAYSMRHAANAYIQKQTEIMFYGTAVSLGVPFVLYFCPRLLLGRSFPLAEVSSVLVVLWPLTLAYTIIKHRFMNIDFIIKRGVAYALVSGFVVAAYFLLVVGVGQLVLFLTGSRSQLV
ncbi:MAG: PDZ domain-containing protein, partial [Calditrichaeota bacterium]